MHALGIAVVSGVPAAAEATGIPERTIYKWTDSPEFAELCGRNKEVITHEWGGFVQRAFRRADELLMATDDPVKAATAGAIMFDKMALWRGEVTSRTENRVWKDDLDPDQQRKLRDWAFERLDAIDGAGVPDPAPEGTGVR